MPLIITCGLPSSGKTYRAKQIVSYLEEKINGPGVIVSGQQKDDSIVYEPQDAAESTVKELSELNLKDASSAATSSSSTTATSAPVNGAASTTGPSISSNKTTRSSTSAESPAASRSNRNDLTRKIYYISDHTLHLPRSAYSVSRTEKDARAALYSAVKRVLSRNDIVILDSGNYIKGWRYQLYCEAKNTGTASCVVHVGLPAERCKEINDARLQKATSQRTSVADTADASDEDTTSKDPLGALEVGGAKEDDPYDAQVLDELLMRFEEPNPMARWDSPLYTVPWDDPGPPCAQIWAEVVQGVGKDGKSRVIRPNQAAVLTPASSTSHLYILDRTTQAVLAAIQAHQREHPEDSDGGGVVAIPMQPSSSIANSSTVAASNHFSQDSENKDGAATDSQTDDRPSTTTKTLTLTLPHQPLTFPHLQRLRRQFVALHRQQMGGLGMGGVGGGIEAGKLGLSEGRVAELFVGFLGERFDEL